MSGGPRLDARSKLGRSLFQLVDASLKMPNDVRTIVIRVRNVIEANPDDKMLRFSLRPDLDALGRNPRLNPLVRSLWKALPS
jgi:hypothetical protein